MYRQLCHAVADFVRAHTNAAPGYDAQRRWADRVGQPPVKESKSKSF